MKVVKTGDRVLDTAIKLYTVAIALIFLRVVPMRYIVLEGVWFFVGAIVVWRVLALRWWAIGAACVLNFLALTYSLMHVFAGNWNQYFGDNFSPLWWNFAAFAMLATLIVGAWRNRKTLSAAL